MSDDLDGLKAEWDSAVADMEHELGEASYVAASLGVQAAQQEHPYTDRTGNLTGTAEAADNARGGKSEAVMVWPMPYAEYVNNGTARSKPYPFTPIAEENAKAALEGLTLIAVERFATRMSSD